MQISFMAFAHFDAFLDFESSHEPHTKVPLIEWQLKLKQST